MATCCDTEEPGKQGLPLTMGVLLSSLFSLCSKLGVAAGVSTRESEQREFACLVG